MAVGQINFLKNTFFLSSEMGNRVVLQRTNDPFGEDLKRLSHLRAGSGTHLVSRHMLKIIKCLGEQLREKALSLPAMFPSPDGGVDLSFERKGVFATLEANLNKFNVRKLSHEEDVETQTLELDLKMKASEMARCCVESLQTLLKPSEHIDINSEI